MAAISISRKRRFIASLIVTVCIMIGIFLFSNQNSGDSGSLSEKVSFFIANIFVNGFGTMSAAEQMEWVNRLSWPVRKTAHATEYGCLAISLFITLWEYSQLRDESLGRVCQDPTKRIALISFGAFVLAVAYACTDEIHQTFIDGRAGQISDVLVDASGAIIGSVLCAIVLLIKTHRMKKRLMSS